MTNKDIAFIEILLTIIAVSTAFSAFCLFFVVELLEKVANALNKKDR